MLTARNLIVALLLVVGTLGISLPAQAGGYKPPGALHISPSKSWRSQNAVRRGERSGFVPRSRGFYFRWRW